MTTTEISTMMTTKTAVTTLAATIYPAIVPYNLHVLLVDALTYIQILWTNQKWNLLRIFAAFFVRM